MPTIKNNLLNQYERPDINQSFSSKPDVGFALKMHHDTHLRGLEINKSHQTEIGNNRVKKDRKGKFLPPIRQAISQHP